MNRGYARAYRNRWIHPAFRNKQEAAIWCWMTDTAAYSSHRIATSFGPVDLQRGQLLAAERTIAKDFCLHRNAVRRFIQLLIDEGMITLKRDHRARNAGTIITVVNYDKYQSDREYMESQEDHLKAVGETTLRPPQDHLGTIRKEYKTNIKDNTVDLAKNQFEELWQVFPSRRPHPNPKKPAREKFILAIKRGVAASEITRGARNYAAYVENQGTDPKFITQAVTWLSQSRWAEYQEIQTVQPQGIGPI